MFNVWRNVNVGIIINTTALMTELIQTLANPHYTHWTLIVTVHYYCKLFKYRLVCTWCLHDKVLALNSIVEIRMLLFTTSSRQLCLGSWPNSIQGLVETTSTCFETVSVSHQSVSAAGRSPAYGVRTFLLQYLGLKISMYVTFLAEEEPADNHWHSYS